MVNTFGPRIFFYDGAVADRYLYLSSGAIRLLYRYGNEKKAFADFANIIHLVLDGRIKNCVLDGFSSRELPSFTVDSIKEFLCIENEKSEEVEETSLCILNYSDSLSVIYTGTSGAYLVPKHTHTIFHLLDLTPMVAVEKQLIYGCQKEILWKKPEKVLIVSTASPLSSGRKAGIRALINKPCNLRKSGGEGEGDAGDSK